MSNKTILEIILLLNFILNIQNFDIAVKIAKSTINFQNLDFKQITESLITQRKTTNNSLESSDFLGPEVLREIVDECFIFEDEKYYYRICMFSNITQHEKSKYFYHSFHGVLGFWKNWYARQDRFDFLLYLNGDECYNGLKRKVALYLECSPYDQVKDLVAVTNVTEIKQCIYLMTLQSPLFCQLGTVYSHLDTKGQMEWDLIHTLYNKKQISHQDYELYLQSIFENYGLTLLRDDETLNKIILDINLQEENEHLPNYLEDLQRCQKELTLLKKNCLL